MVSTHEGFTDNSPRSTMTPTPVKKPSVRISLCIFTYILDEKKKTAICQVRAAKKNHKAIKAGTTAWGLKPKQNENS